MAGDRQGLHRGVGGFGYLIAGALGGAVGLSLLLALPPEAQEEATERSIVELSATGSLKLYWWATDDRACSTTPMNWTSPINMRDAQESPRKRRRQ